MQNNTVVGGGEAGIYLGDSADAGAKVTHNEVSGAGFGIFIRHSSGISAQLNHLFSNCQGIMVLDDGSGRRERHRDPVQLRHVQQQSLRCVERMSGLVGRGHPAARRGGLAVTWNTVRGNTGTEINSGGIVLMSAAVLTDGANPTGDTVKNNTAFQNSPADISSDGTGTGNELSGNYCHTSLPSGSCV